MSKTHRCGISTPMNPSPLNTPAACTTWSITTMISPFRSSDHDPVKVGFNLDTTDDNGDGGNGDDDGNDGSDGDDRSNESPGGGSAGSSAGGILGAIAAICAALGLSVMF